MRVTCTLKVQGGNPLDFKSGITASVSVQSTSITGQPHEQFVTRLAILFSFNLFSCIICVLSFYSYLFVY